MCWSWERAMMLSNSLALSKNWRRHVRLLFHNGPINALLLGVAQFMLVGTCICVQISCLTEVSYMSPIVIPLCTWSNLFNASGKFGLLNVLSSGDGVVCHWLTHNIVLSSSECGGRFWHNPYDAYWKEFTNDDQRKYSILGCMWFFTLKFFCASVLGLV